MTSSSRITERTKIWIIGDEIPWIFPQKARKRQPCLLVLRRETVRRRQFQRDARQVLRGLRQRVGLHAEAGSWITIPLRVDRLQHHEVVHVPVEIAGKLSSARSSSSKRSGRQARCIWLANLDQAAQRDAPSARRDAGGVACSGRCDGHSSWRPSPGRRARIRRPRSAGCSAGGVRRRNPEQVVDHPWILALSNGLRIQSTKVRRSSMMSARAACRAAAISSCRRRRHLAARARRSPYRRARAASPGSPRRNSSGWSARPSRRGRDRCRNAGTERHRRECGRAARPRRSRSPAPGMKSSACRGLCGRDDLELQALGIGRLPDRSLQRGYVAGNRRPDDIGPAAIHFGDALIDRRELVAQGLDLFRLDEGKLLKVEAGLGEPAPPLDYLLAQRIQRLTLLEQRLLPTPLIQFGDQAARGRAMRPRRPASRRAMRSCCTVICEVI